MIIDLLFFGFGILIGVNWRNSYAERKERLLFDQVDEKVRNELTVAKNLNKSLLDDVRFLRNKLERIKDR